MRWTLRIFVALVCSASLVIALEIAAIVLRMRTEQANPLIRTHAAGGQLTRSEVPPLRPPPSPLESPEHLPSWLRPIDGVVLERYVPSPSLDMVPDRTDSAAFFDLSQDAREDYARVRSKEIVVLSPAGAIVRIHGSRIDELGLAAWPLWPIRNWWIAPEPWQSAARELGAMHVDAIRTGAAQRQSWLLPGHGESDRLVDVVVLPQPQGGGATAIVEDTHPGVMRAPMVQDLPEDSFAAVPWHRYRPNSATAMRNFTTNNVGLRGDDVILPKPPGRFRILCIGGSTTEEGETNATTYPAVLQHIARETYPGADIEVLNAGVAGTMTYGHLSRWPEYQALEPDILVIHAGVNDAWAFARGIPATFESRILLSWSQFVVQYAPALAAPSRHSVRDQLEQQTGRNLALLTDMARHHGVAVVIASFASPDLTELSSVEEAYFDWNIRQFWNAPHIRLRTYVGYVGELNRVIETVARARSTIYAPVAERVVGSLNVFGDVCHMMPAGSALKARVVFESMQPMLDALFNSGAAELTQSKEDP